MSFFKKPAAPKAAPKAITNLAKSDTRQNKLQRDRRAMLKLITEVGAKPSAPSNFFVPCNKDFCNVPITHVVACKMEPGLFDPVLGHQNRTNRRRKFHVNCGKPTAANQDAGKVLWGDWAPNTAGVLEHAPWPAFREPLPQEQYLYHLTDPKLPAKAGKKAKRDQADPHAAEPMVTDPSRMPDPTVDYVFDSSRRVYSDADIAGRYVGWKALTTSATTAWTSFVLNLDIDYATGKPVTADKPTSETDDENDALYKQQQETVRNACRKFYLVCPVPVDGCIGPEGELYPIGELEKAKAEQRDPSPLTYKTEEEAAKYAPQPVQFVSIVSDKREDVEGGGHNIAGYHDETRAWPLQPAHVEQLRKILHHYDLEAEFPALANLNPKRNTSVLDLNMLRQDELEALGEPPPKPCHEEELVCKRWLAKVSEVPFGKAWVQKCDAEHVNGCVIHGTNIPLLVPLRKDRAEERNGIPWLDVEKIDRSTAEGEQKYVDVQTMLHRIVGKAWNKGAILVSSAAARKRKATSDPCESDGEDPDGSLRASLQEASKVADDYRQRNIKLNSEVDALSTEVANLKAEKQHMILHGTSERPAIVDIQNGRDAKCIFRWDKGKVDIHFGDKTIKVDCADHMIAVRFMPTDEELPAFPRLLMNNDADNMDYQDESD